MRALAGEKCIRSALERDLIALACFIRVLLLHNISSMASPQSTEARGGSRWGDRHQPGISPQRQQPPQQLELDHWDARPCFVRPPCIAQTAPGRPALVEVSFWVTAPIADTAYCRLYLRSSSDVLDALDVSPCVEGVASSGRGAVSEEHLLTFRCV